MEPILKNPIWKIAVLGIFALGVVVYFGILKGPNTNAPDPQAVDPDVESLALTEVADPRLAKGVIWRNVRPEVEYVGDDACRVCHEGICDSYHGTHTMARSSSYSGKPDLAGRTGIERFDAGSQTSVTNENVTYKIENRGDKGLHQSETFLDNKSRPVVTREVDYAVAIGSGHRGRSYILEQHGWLYQASMSWFSSAGIWDISPGLQLDQENPGRPVTRLCLFCHTNQVKLIAGTQNKFEPFATKNLGIGCERCHGPGKLHCDERANDPATAYGTGPNRKGKGPPDTSVVNPARLEPELRESVCNQCHLQGEKRVEKEGLRLENWRPGLKLSDFVVVWARNPILGEKNKAVGQVEQMHASKCFQKSGGALGCMTCHDPHFMPPEKERKEWYRNQCYKCHANDSPKEGVTTTVATPGKTDPTRGILPPCSQPLVHRLARQNDCAACHLPRRASTDIAHTALSDHRIRRRPPVEEPLGRALLPGELPLVGFPGPATPADDRELVIALSLMSQGMTSTQNPFAGFLAKKLDSLLLQRPGDAELWSWQANRLSREGRFEESLLVWERIHKTKPKEEFLLLGTTLAAVRAKKYPRALVLAKRLAEISPENATHLVMVADILKTLKRYPEALPYLEQAIASQPAGVQSRKILVECLVQTHQPERAQTEFDTLVRLTHSGEGDLRRWFAKIQSGKP
ncbi:MAG: hypothetical protein DWI28_02180 [Planctomycetota bacterium]|nr:MAG: hypothetical protein DWI28_02180 [Planctomycetota bacterium]